MQILGLADSTPKPQNRLKTLLWPEIRHETDVDDISRQGFWICVLIAIVSLGLGVFQGGAVLVAECLEGGFFFLSGVGIRARSTFAASCAFAVYFASSFVVGFGIVRLIFGALLLANVRGTRLSAQWRSSQTEPPPVPLTETFLDRFADRMPISVWPVGRYIYFGLAAVEIGLLALVLASKFVPGVRH